MKMMIGTPLLMSGMMVVLSLGALPPAAVGQEADGAQLCALTQVLECVDGLGCAAIEPATIGAPRFLKVDPEEKRIMDPEAAEDAPGSAVLHAERIDGKMILQGTDPGVEELRDGIGWTVAITEETGGMVLTAASEDVAYVAFGECLSTP